MRPARYYGWTIAWTLAVTQTIGFGVLYYAFSVFVTPIEAELGFTRAQTTGAFSVALLASGLAAPWCGRWVDRHGARGLMSVGSLAGAGLVFAWAHVGALWQLYAVQALIGLVMAAVLYDVAFTVLAVWFRARRTRAMLIVTLVAGLASTVFVPLATLLEAQLGWRDALRVLSLILLVGTVPLHALALRRRPEDLGLETDGLPARAERGEPSVTARQALRAAPFWWLSLAFALSRVTVVAVGAHSVPLLLARGHGPTEVALAVGSIGLWQLAGRVLFTPAAGHVPLRHLSAYTFGVHALAFLVLQVVPGAVGMWSFAALFGLGNGAVTLARAALVAEQFGAAHYGVINGGVALVIAVAQTTAPLGAGLLYDAAASYAPVVWTLLLTSALAAAAVTRLPAPNRTTYAD